MLRFFPNAKRSLDSLLILHHRSGHGRASFLPSPVPLAHSPQRGSPVSAKTAGLPENMTAAPVLCAVDDSREFRRGELGKNSLVSICTKFISAAVSSPTITGGSLSGNNASTKVKRLFAGCPLYRSTSKLNGIFAQHSPFLHLIWPYFHPLKRPNSRLTQCWWA